MPNYPYHEGLHCVSRAEPPSQKQTTNTIVARIHYETATTRQEKLLTLREFVQFGRIKVGQRILVGKVSGDYRSSTQTIVVGDCTPYIGPFTGTSDCGVGWPHEKDLMDLYVLEVLEIE